MEHINTFKAAAVAFFGALTALFGWFGWLIIMLVVCQVIDYITGSIAASMNGEWSSKVARAGICHKVGALIAVSAAGIVDILLGLIINNIGAIILPFKYSVLICPIVVAWYIITELGSITENAAAMGAPVPEFLKKTIKLCHEGVDTAGNKLAASSDVQENDVK